MRECRDAVAGLDRRTFLAGGLALGAVAAEAKKDAGGAAIDVADRACFFLDDRFIAEMDGLKRTWHQGKPRTEIALTEREPWEQNLHLYGSVLYDPETKLYKMWYQGNPDRGAIYYAESKDGKAWEKPKLGLFTIKGRKDNNCVVYGGELPNVFLDPRAADPGARFKM